MTAPIDYNAVLADLVAKRGQIDAAIAVIRSLVEGLQTDTFFRMSTSQAVRKFLQMVKHPQTPRAIADALRNGGQVHAADAKIAYTNVQSALRRGKDGEFVQTRNKEWGLAEWYSGKPKGEGNPRRTPSREAGLGAWLPLPAAQNQIDPTPPGWFESSGFPLHAAPCAIGPPALYCTPSGQSSPARDRSHKCSPPANCDV